MIYLPKNDGLPYSSYGNDYQRVARRSISSLDTTNTQKIAHG